ncbi:unnamed protein product [Rotaria sordida]|uniref:DYW domain-containing protein n=1 Tax=Rotaria sordida TaxID=392033 RepID=A0A819D5R8_9BILA|nr:unnamed protein product [Rotaria sordida]
MTLKSCIHLYNYQYNIKTQEQILSNSLKNFFIQTSFIHFYNRYNHNKYNHHLFSIIVNKTITIYSNICIGLMSKKIFDSLNKIIFAPYNYLHDKLSFSSIFNLYFHIDYLNDLLIFDETEKMINDYEKSNFFCSVIDMTMLSDIYVDQHLILTQKLDNTMKHLFFKMYSSSSKHEQNNTIHSNKKKELENKIKQEKSITNVNGQLWEFTVDDRSHPRFEEINAELDRIAIELVKHGHNLDSAWITPKVREATLRASASYYRSGRLALAFNLIQRSVPFFIQITNDIRTCQDCHEFMKPVVKLGQCKITICNSNRIHRFYKNGECSCKDYF